MVNKFTIVRVNVPRYVSELRTSRGADTFKLSAKVCRYMNSAENMTVSSFDYQPLQGHVAHDGAYIVRSPSAMLAQWVQCYWQLNVPIGTFSYHSVPDNSVDWIINLNRPEESFIVPPFTSSLKFELNGPVSYFGTRFRLFGQQGLISTPIGEWAAADGVVNAAELISNQIRHAVLDLFQKASKFDDRCSVLTSCLLSTLKHADVDARLAHYVRYCLESKASNIDLSDRQCSEFGVSARQLRRLTKTHLGLIPRDFAKIIRFQQTLKAMSLTGSSSVWIDHYYDQPHYNREFKSLSGFTPTQFNRLSVLYNQGSDS